MQNPGMTNAQVLRRLIETAAEAIQGPVEPDSPYEAVRRVIRHAGFALQELGDSGERARAATDLKLAAGYAEQIAASCAAVEIPAIDIETAVTITRVAQLVYLRVQDTFPARNRDAGERVAGGLLRMTLGLQGWGVHGCEEMVDNATAARDCFADAASLAKK